MTGSGLWFEHDQLVERTLAGWDRSLPVDLRRIAADIGVIVGPPSPALTGGHGRTEWHDDGRIVTTFATSVAEPRWRFALAHELAHVLLRGARLPDDERSCNRIAARLLVPGGAVADRLARTPRVRLRDVRSLAEDAHVSQRVAAARVTEQLRRTCSLLDWRRSPSGEWLCMSFVALDEPKVGVNEIELADGAAAAIEAMPLRKDTPLDLRIQCRRVVHEVTADTRRGHDWATMLLDGGLRRSRRA